MVIRKVRCENAGGGVIPLSKVRSVGDYSGECDELRLRATRSRSSLANLFAASCQTPKEVRVSQTQGLQVLATGLRPLSSAVEPGSH